MKIHRNTENIIIYITLFIFHQNVIMESELSEESTLRPQFTVDDLDIEILPIIYEIIRRFVHFNNLIMKIVVV